MSVTIKGREYDYAAECFYCPNEFHVFGTREERDAWRKKHNGHETFVYLQGRV